jgi:outer membrane protein assembly factor BamB
MRSLRCSAAALLCISIAAIATAQSSSAPPTPAPLPPATYAWKVDNVFLAAHAEEVSPLVRDGMIVVPVRADNITGVAALNVSTGAVLWNFTMTLSGIPWLPQDGDRRHVYLMCDHEFVAIDVMTGQPTWGYDPGEYGSDSYPSVSIAVRDVIAVSDASGRIQVLNATTGHVLVSRTYSTEAPVVMTGDHDTIFLSSMDASGTVAIQRIDLRTNQTVWNTTNADIAAGVLGMQMQRDELLVTGILFVAVLDVKSGAVKNTLGSNFIGSTGAVLPRATGSLIAIPRAAETHAWNSVCALNTTTMQCAWETFNATCGQSSAASGWNAAQFIAYVGADVLVTVGNGDNCLHGYSSLDGTLLWTAGGNPTDSFTLPSAFAGPGNSTTVVSLDLGSVIFTIDAHTGATNKIQAPPNLEATSLTVNGLIIGVSSYHVYGIHP